VEPPGLARLRFNPDLGIDRGLMACCLALSSSDAVRAAAAAWLAAYDAARAAGAPEEVAQEQAAAAWRVAADPRLVGEGDGCEAA
jgi:hypothetical protein